MTPSQEQLAAITEAYTAERERLTAPFDAYWDTHANRADGGRACRVPGGWHPDCPHTEPAEPESETETVRRVVLGPIDGDSAIVAFGRWQYLLGKSAQADDDDNDEASDNLEPWLIVSWRLAVLTYQRSFSNELDLTIAEEAIDAMSKESEPMRSSVAAKLRKGAKVTVTIHGQMVRALVHFATQSKIEAVTLEGQMFVVRAPEQVLQGHNRLAL